jgi:hypothetical protein
MRLLVVGISKTEQRATNNEQRFDGYPPMVSDFPPVIRKINAEGPLPPFPGVGGKTDFTGPEGLF